MKFISIKSLIYVFVSIGPQSIKNLFDIAAFILNKV
jgi:hypothetical protein